MSKLPLGPAARKIISGPEPKTMEEALQNASDLIAESKKGNDAYAKAVKGDEDILDTIREYAADIESTKRQLKTLREAAKEEKENTSEFEEVTTAKEAYETAKARLKQSLLGNHHYNQILENIGELNHKLNDQKDILSLHIVEHYAKTHDRQIEIDPSNGDARDVVVTGKLGKKGKLQTSLFSDNKRSYEISDGKTTLKIDEDGIHQ